MQKLLEKAIFIAISAHKGQVDKGGNLYILHPLRVMLAMENVEEQIVAMLHDVIEDSKITIKELEDNKFPKQILEAVALLTKKNDQPYEDYILAIKKNSLARKVKQADLKDNMNKNRLKKVTEADQLRIIKYKKAYKLLAT